MVLFIFVIMMLNLGRETAQQESLWLAPGVWRGPAMLCSVLLLELALFLFQTQGRAAAGTGVPPKAVGIALFGPYALAVELASLLLLAGLVGAYHLGRRARSD
jgi:NADH-quinone oxidoreductase subunit J